MSPEESQELSRIADATNSEANNIHCTRVTTSPTTGYEMTNGSRSRR